MTARPEPKSVQRTAAERPIHQHRTSASRRRARRPASLTGHRRGRPKLPGARRSPRCEPRRSVTYLETWRSGRKRPSNSPSLGRRSWAQCRLSRGPGGRHGRRGSKRSLRKPPYPYGQVPDRVSGRPGLVMGLHEGVGGVGNAAAFPAPVEQLHRRMHGFLAHRPGPEPRPVRQLVAAPRPILPTCHQCHVDWPAAPDDGRSAVQRGGRRPRARAPGAGAGSRSRTVGPQPSQARSATRVISWSIALPNLSRKTVTEVTSTDSSWRRSSSSHEIRDASDAW
jgi:hypothetical protein